MSAHLPTIRRRIPARLRRMSTEARPTLPRLPVPPLQQTIDRYLKSLEPFLLEDDARGGPSFTSSYNLREKWAQEFRGGVGKLCQQRLIGLSAIPLYLVHFMNYSRSGQEVT